MTAVLLGSAILTTASYFLSLEADQIRRVSKMQFKFEQAHQPTPNETQYDFIIVGAGTAGCILASEISKYYSVLLIEAGGPPPPLTFVPALRLSSHSLPEFNWLYNSVPQRNLFNRRLLRPIAKAFGGSFVHNALIFNRGNPRDYDTWANLTKDNSWKYKNVLPIFKKIEHYSGPFPSDERGKYGKFPVRSTQAGFSPVTRYVEAAKELGLSYLDSNGPQRPGITPMDSSYDKHGRSTTSCSILVDPILALRKTLTLKLYSEVDRILFKNQRAIGIQYKKHGKKFLASATKEVIVSAGAFGSPLLLFKSGIGPSKMLQDAGIQLVKNLPVGAKLDEHTVTAIAFNVKAFATTNSVYYNLTMETVKTYLKKKEDGILSTAVPGPQAFFVTNIAKQAGEGDWPDVQFLQQMPTGASNGKSVFAVTLAIARPKSYGTICLNTSSYLRGERRNTKLALIDYNFLHNPDDLNVLLTGIKKTIQFYKTKPFQDLNIELVPDPDCATSNRLWSRNYFTCCIRKKTLTYWHATSTCKMGFGPTDPTATVDTTFRVIGIRRLRIVDVSIIPQITNANVNAPTILLAFKAAKTILRFHREQFHGQKM